MQKWEYRVVDKNERDAGYIDEQELNEMGQEGWELMFAETAGNGMFFAVFKRPIAMTTTGTLELSAPAMALSPTDLCRDCNHPLASHGLGGCQVHSGGFPCLCSKFMPK